MRVFIGMDERMPLAFDVAAKTARQYGCEVIALREAWLRICGILTRPVDHRGGMYDLNSSAPQSTEFAIARFAVPLLAHSGWCLFADSDVVFLRDPHELMELADPKYAVMVVKHAPISVGGVKMDGQTQTLYERKLWSSIMLFNADHQANKRLNLQMLNQWPGRDLHALKWLADSEIGELPKEWNHLVGINPHSDVAKILHFTLGTPDLPGYENSEYADIWRTASQR